MSDSRGYSTTTRENGTTKDGKVTCIRQTRFTCRIALAALLAIACSAESARADEEPLASAILDTTGFPGGLIVHVNSNGGKLTAALKANDGTIMHGLDNGAADVASARKHFRAAGAYGAVSVEMGKGPTLPYADRMVYLFVAGESVDFSRDEVLRVLCPGGQAVFLSDAAVPAAYGRLFLAPPPPPCGRRLQADRRLPESCKRIYIARGSPLDLGSLGRQRGFGH